jgi:glucokinase
MGEGKFIVGLEIGGTKTAAALADPSSKVLELRKRATPLFSSRAIVSAAEELIDELLDRNGVESEELMGIGLGVAGMIDFKEGLVVFSPNLPLRNVPFRDLISDYYRCPAFLDNDANVAALGEKYYGHGRGVSNFITVTLGTGIGAGIIIGGNIYRGATGSAGEVGHTIIALDGPPCTCGSNGCFEALASGQAITRRGKEESRRKLGGKLLELAEGKEENITGELVSRAAREGDETCQDILSEIGRLVGIGLTNIVNVFNPELIVISGGMSEAGELLLEPARKVVKEQALIPNSQAVRIVTTALGDRVGVMGAAALALHELSS